MKLSIIGYYGANFGDLIMLESLIHFFSKKYSTIVVFTYGDADLLRSNIHGMTDVNLEVVSLSNNIFNFIKCVNGSSSILWGGGTCFMDQGGTGGVKYMLFSYLMGIKVFYVGIGIDKCEKIITNLCLTIAGFISKGLYFRDIKSYNIMNGKLYFNREKIGLISDLAYLESRQKSKISINESGYLFFCNRDFSEYKNINGIESNIGLIELAINICRLLNIRKIYNLNCDIEVDSEVSKLSNEIFVKNGLIVNEILGYETEKVLQCIENARFVLTARLHPAVIAQIAEIPYGIFNYSDKNLKFTEENNEKDRLIEIQSINNFKPKFTRPTNPQLRTKVSNIINVLNAI